MPVRPAPGAALVARLALPLLLGVVPASPAAAAWLPLAVGNQWQYVDDAEELHTEAIVDQVHVRGRHGFVKQYTGGPDDGLLNFWQEGPGGSVLLLGYYKPAWPFGLLYEPPVEIFPALPAPGYEWHTHTVAYAIPDNVVFGEFDTYWSVVAEQTMLVPAGTFDAFGVSQVAPPADPAVVRGVTLRLDGRVRDGSPAAFAPGPASAAEWYAEGTGLVQYDTGTLYVLRTAFGPTPASSSSWGRLKRLYR